MGTDCSIEGWEIPGNSSYLECYTGCGFGDRRKVKGRTIGFKTGFRIGIHRWQNVWGRARLRLRIGLRTWRATGDRRNWRVPQVTEHDIPMPNLHTAMAANSPMLNSQHAAADRQCR